MSDRRMGERRSPEKGIIKLPLKKLLIWVIVVAIILILVISNIIFLIMYSNTKKELDLYTGDDNKEYVENVGQYEVHIDADKKEISAGETINFNIRINVNNTNGQGVIMLETLFLYNTEFFDCKISGFTSNNWELKYILNNYFIVSKKDLIPSYENEIVATASFTSKKDIKSSEQTISFDKLKIVLEGQDEIDFPKQSFNIPIKVL